MSVFVLKRTTRRLHNATEAVLAFDVLHEIVIHYMQGWS